MLLSWMLIHIRVRLLLTREECRYFLELPALLWTHSWSPCLARAMWKTVEEERTMGPQAKTSAILGSYFFFFENCSRWLFWTCSSYALLCLRRPLKASLKMNTFHISTLSMDLHRNWGRLHCEEQGATENLCYMKFWAKISILWDNLENTEFFAWFFKNCHQILWKYFFLFSASSSSSSSSGFHPFEMAAQVCGGHGKPSHEDVPLGLCWEAGWVRQASQDRKEYWGRAHWGP